MSPELRREYALSALRLAVQRARLLASQGELIGISLKQESISPRAAIRWASDVGLFDLVPTEEIERASEMVREAVE